MTVLVIYFLRPLCYYEASLTGEPLTMKITAVIAIAAVALAACDNNPGTVYVQPQQPQQVIVAPQQPQQIVVVNGQYGYHDPILGYFIAGALINGMFSPGYYAYGDRRVEHRHQTHVTRNTTIINNNAAPTPVNPAATNTHAAPHPTANLSKPAVTPLPGSKPPVTSPVMAPSASSPIAPQYRAQTPATTTFTTTAKPAAPAPAPVSTSQYRAPAPTAAASRPSAPTTSSSSSSQYRSSSSSSSTSSSSSSSRR